jgi:hypothetical protein
MEALGADVDQLHDEARVADLKARKGNLERADTRHCPYLTVERRLHVRLQGR